MLRNIRSLVATFFILAISFAFVAEAAIPASERAALIALYGSTGGANWSSKSGWLGPAGTECDWYGVTCDAVGGRVMRLYLSSNNLVGGIPSSITDLYLIQRLRMGGNHLTGTIPSLYGFWIVEEIDLSDNELTGTIPTQIGDKAGYNLQILNLANNQLTGGIPSSLGVRKALKYLYLSGNQLSGAIPAELSQLYPLQTFDISRNQFSGPIPTQPFSNLPNLTRLYLNDNRFTGAIPRQLSNLTSLQYLYLQGNKLAGPIPTQLAGLTTLRNGSGLDLRWNAVSTSDSSLTTFLNTKQVGGDWQSTQTVAPTGVGTSAPTHNSVTLEWTPIAYTADSGFYQVFVSGVSGGPYSAFETVTDSKAFDSLVVTGLDSESTYFFVVKTTTEAHAKNLNELVSEMSAEASATTSAPPVYADIGVAVVESVDPVLAGNEVSYTITATNNGPSGATGVELGVDLILPDHVTVNSILADKGTVTGTAPNYTWAIGDVANGESSDLDLELTVESGSAGGTDVISVEASVTGLTEVDAQTENDQDSQSTSIAPVIPAIERAALLALYNSTAGASWTTKTNWGGALGTECTWFGVTCNEEDTAVVSLVLDDNNLSGSIPAALGNLTSLQYLSLRFNNLVGGIPNELGGLSFLSELYLNVNELSGEVPPELGSLSSLTKLNLSVNVLTGPIPSSLGSLGSLEVLTLDGNDLTRIPPELGNLSALKELRIGYNDLGGTNIPPELGNLDSVQYFILVGNGLGGNIPPELGNLDSVLNLNLAGNELTGSIPAELRNLSTLTGLHLYDNQLSGSIPPALGDLASLDWLDLSQNELSGAVPSEIGDLSLLTKLWLHSNHLSGELPPELGSLSALQWLLLADNDFEGGIPDEIGSLTSLQVLDLAANQFSGGIPENLTHLPVLQTLGLESNRFSGRIPDGITNLSYLYPGKTDLRWNGFYTDNAAVVDFLNENQEGGDWQGTQTIAPEDLSVDSVGDHTVWLRWSSVSYADPGGYEVFYSPGGLDQWVSGGWTDSKSDTTFPVTGLDPSADYDFVVTSYTLPHADNENDVISDPGAIVSAVTSEIGCIEPDVDVHYGALTVLTLTTIHDSAAWSTGETTTSIVVDPPSSRWFWVTTTGPGGCEEAATVFVNDSILFVDGFESGDCQWWSSAVGLSQ